MPRVAFAFALAALAGSGTQPLTFEVEVVQRQAGMANGGLAIDPAPGGDHYELWQVEKGTRFETVTVLRADKDFTKRWSVDVGTSEETRQFEQVAASETDSNGDFVFITFDSSYAYGSGCDTRLHKVDQNGAVVYDKQLGHAACHQAEDYKLTMLGGGEVLVAGVSGNRGFLQRYSATGVEELDRDYYKDRIRLITTALGGRLFALMHINGHPKLCELDNEGNLVWDSGFSLGPVYDPRFVDLTVNARDQLVLTVQLQAEGQAGRVAVYQYPNNGVGAPDFYSVSANNSMKFTSGYRVFVEHDPTGAVYLAWTKEKDTTATVEMVMPTPPNTGRTTDHSKVLPSGTIWSKVVTIGQLRGLARMSHGGVMLLGAGQPSKNDEVLEVHALDSAGKLVGDDTLPGASDPWPQEAPPKLALMDWFVEGNRVFATGRGYGGGNSSSDSAQRMRYWFGEKSTTKPPATKPTPSRPASSKLRGDARPALK